MGGRGQGHMRLSAEEPELKPDSEHHGGSFRNYMIVKNRHLHAQYEEQVKTIKAAGSCSNIFNGISIHVNGYTSPTHQELKHLMALHGGYFENYYSRDRVTHIICSNLPDAKVKQFQKERNPTPIVRPEWIVDSIKAGAVLPILDYVLWRLRDAPGQKTLSEFQAQPITRSASTVGGGNAAHVISAAAFPANQRPASACPTFPSPLKQDTQSTRPTPASLAEPTDLSAAFPAPLPVLRQKAHTPSLPSTSPSSLPIDFDPTFPDPQHVLHKKREASMPAESFANLHGDAVLAPVALQAAPVSKDGPLTLPEFPTSMEGPRVSLELLPEDIVPGDDLQPHLRRDGSPASTSNGDSNNHRDTRGDEMALWGDHPGLPADVQECGALGISERGPRGDGMGTAHDRGESAKHLPQSSHFKGPQVIDRHSSGGPASLVALGSGVQARAPLLDASLGPKEAVEDARRSSTGQMLSGLGPGRGLKEQYQLNRPEGGQDEAGPGELIDAAQYGGEGHPDGEPETSGALQGNEVLRRAQEVAAAARAACDVLRGAPRSSRDDPQFMETFYKSSRLHFIGTWKARIEALAQQMVNEAAAPTPAPRGKGERAVIHIDMDCFFAAVAALHDPVLKGLPLAVCHSNSSKGCGEVSSASYEARAFGIRAGMWINDAKQRCPHLIIMPYQFDKYEAISEKVYKILMQHTVAVQPLSCDEAFLDVTGLGDPEVLAAKMRSQIVDATGCTASVGIGPNMLVARLATKQGKPNGQFRIRPPQVDQYLLGLGVEDLPGVGWSMKQQLHQMGIRTVADVRQRSCPSLQRDVGEKKGLKLWEAAHGKDDRFVEPPGKRKSVGAEVNWGIRFDAEADAITFLEKLAGDLAQRMAKAGVRGRTVTLKLMRRKAGAPEAPKFLGHGICDNLSRSVTLPRFTASSHDLFLEGRSLLRALRVPATQIRGMGLAVSKLDNDQASKVTRPTAPAPSKAAAPPASVYNPSKPSGYELFFKTFAPEVNVSGPLDAQPSADPKPLRSLATATPVKQASLHAVFERRSRRESLDDTTGAGQGDDHPSGASRAGGTGMLGTDLLPSHPSEKEAGVSGEDLNPAPLLLQPPSVEETGVSDKDVDPATPHVNGDLMRGNVLPPTGLRPSDVPAVETRHYAGGSSPLPRRNAARESRGPSSGLEAAQNADGGVAVAEESGDLDVRGLDGGGDWGNEEGGDIEVEEWSFPNLSEDEEEGWKELGSQESGPGAAVSDRNDLTDACPHSSEILPTGLGAPGRPVEEAGKPGSPGATLAHADTPVVLGRTGSRDAGPAPVLPALSEIGAAEFAQLPVDVQQALLQGAGVPTPPGLHDQGVDPQRVVEHVAEGGPAWEESEALVDPEFGGAPPRVPNGRPGSASGFGLRSGSVAGVGSVRGARLPGLPSASQVDPSVLDALPLPLKRELERALGIGVYRSPPKRKRGGGISVGTKRPSKQPRLQLDTFTSPVKARVAVNGLAMTQIDPAVLAELPEDVRLELQAALPASRQVFTIRGNLDMPPHPPDTAKMAMFPNHATAIGPDNVYIGHDSLDLPKGQACRRRSDPGEDPRQVWASVQIAMENLNDELESQSCLPSASCSTGVGYPERNPSASPRQSRGSEACFSEGDPDRCPQSLASSERSPAFGEVGSGVADIGTDVNEEGQLMDDTAGGTDVGGGERNPQPRTAALFKLLQEWACGLVSHDLEGLQFVLRRLTGATEKWPLLAPQLNGCIAAVQAAVQEHYGAPLKVF